MFTTPKGYGLVFLDWNCHDEERFKFLNTQWDVNAAKDILAKSQPTVGDLNLATVKEFLPPLPSAGEMLSASYAPPATFLLLTIGLDFQKLIQMVTTWKPETLAPVILTPYAGSYLPIDGWHRIATGIICGEKTLPAVSLTVKESRKCAGGNLKVIK